MSKSFLAIDKLRLDDEWLGQPQLYFTYAEKLAEARRVLDNASAEVDAVWAELDSKIRRKPAKYGFDSKPTEGAIGSKIQRISSYKEVLRRKIDAKFEVDINQAAVIALEHRKRALTELVELQLSAYYSAPVARSEGAKHIVESSRQKKLAKRTIGRLKED